MPRSVNNGSSADGPILRLEDVRQSYGAVQALRGVSLSVRRGEFLTLLGPSGSGKSTLLRVIAGLEEPDSVTAMDLDGHSMIGVPPEKRNVATVFQHYALFPHMSVGENVEYSLRIRKIDPAERRKRAEAMLALVRLNDKYDRRIHQLSGGERQRVALARSLAMGPDILLLDEPLGALDERLRLDMQRELIELQRKADSTFILVTHSQEEAISMSDRIILMRDGAIEQIGTPRELFSMPRTEFAARFMGFENVLRGSVVAQAGERCEIDVAGTRITGQVAGGDVRLAPGDQAFAAIRAEHIRTATGAGQTNRFSGTSGEPFYKGHFFDVPFTTSIGDLVVRVGEAGSVLPPQSELSFQPEHCIVGPLGGKDHPSATFTSGKG
ncbi:MAG TPA: ABC transporter ATP-binding protein [Devosia sp.]|nr:ABC transporter ATP-binding protein [Devosia sp.]